MLLLSSIHWEQPLGPVKCPLSGPHSTALTNCAQAPPKGQTLPIPNAGSGGNPRPCARPALIERRPGLPHVRHAFARSRRYRRQKPSTNHHRRCHWSRPSLGYRHETPAGLMPPPHRCQRPRQARLCAPRIAPALILPPDGAYPVAEARSAVQNQQVARLAPMQFVSERRRCGQTLQ